MPFSGSSPNKTYSRTTGLYTGTTAWTQTEAAGRGIEETDHDTHDQDMAAAINTSIQKDGSNKPTADIDWGGQKITNLGEPSGGSDATTKDYVDGVAGGQTNFTVRLASTVAGNLTTDVDAGSTFDSVVLVEGDRILLKNQAAATANGIYLVPAAAGTATRATDFDLWTEVVGAVVNVTAGTVNAGTSWRSTANTGGTIGATDLDFVAYGTSVTLPLGVTSGGTGAVTAAAAFTAIKQNASESATGVVELATTAEAAAGVDTSRAVTAAGVAAAVAALGGGISAATQAEMEAATLTTVGASPGRQHFHPGHPKAAAKVTVSGGTPTLQSTTDFNITSITDTGTGRLTITIATDFSDAHWVCVATAEVNQDVGASASDPEGYFGVNIDSGGQAAGSVILEIVEAAYAESNSNFDTAFTDPVAWHMIGIGDHA